MRLRAATADDVEGVLVLEESIFGPEAWSRASVLEELAGPRRTAVVACAPDVVGYAVTAAVGDVVDLHRIAVHPSWRRNGVAHDLLAAVRAPGRMLLEVSADNAAGMAFYAAEGFVEIARRGRYYRDGSDAVVMESPPP